MRGASFWAFFIAFDERHLSGEEEGVDHNCEENDRDAVLLVMRWSHLIAFKIGMAIGRDSQVNQP
jgi:hypothetical protein